MNTVTLISLVVVAAAAIALSWYDARLERQNAELQAENDDLREALADLEKALDEADENCRAQIELYKPYPLLATKFDIREGEGNRWELTATDGETSLILREFTEDDREFAVLRLREIIEKIKEG